MHCLCRGIISGTGRLDQYSYESRFLCRDKIMEECEVSPTKPKGIPSYSAVLYCDGVSAQLPSSGPGRYPRTTQNKCPRHVEPPHARLPTTYDTTTPLRVRQVRLTAPTTPHHTVAPDCTHVRRPQGGTVAHPWRELDATSRSRGLSPKPRVTILGPHARPPEGH